jgi:hypothetical protein
MQLCGFVLLLEHKELICSVYQAPITCMRDTEDSKIFDLPRPCEIGPQAMMHGNDNKTRERELGQPGLEHMHLVCFL